jgi:hypothetical protein
METHLDWYVSGRDQEKLFHAAKNVYRHYYKKDGPNTFHLYFWVAMIGMIGALPDSLPGVEVAQTKIHDHCVAIKIQKGDFFYIIGSYIEGEVCIGDLSVAYPNENRKKVRPDIVFLLTYVSPLKTKNGLPRKVIAGGKCHVPLMAIEINETIHEGKDDRAPDIVRKDAMKIDYLQHYTPYVHSVFPKDLTTSSGTWIDRAKLYANEILNYLSPEIIKERLSA